MFHCILPLNDVYAPYNKRVIFSRRGNARCARTTKSHHHIRNHNNVYRQLNEDMV